MKSYDIEDLKEYMNELLINEKFDSFYVYEARIKTALDYYISGRVNKDFFDSDEQTKLDEYVTWREMKHTVYELIKGKRLPISFKLILMFNRDNVTRLLEMNNIPINEQDVSALFYNIYFENGLLTVTTGSSLKIFTLDKTLDNVWDETVSKYYI